MKRSALKYTYIQTYYTYINIFRNLYFAKILIVQMKYKCVCNAFVSVLLELNVFIYINIYTNAF